MQNKPDVRIRLSAEGVNEVVQALKQVQAAAGQTKKSVDAAGSGFGSTIKNVLALKTAVGALAATAGVGLGVQFVTSFAQTADAAAKLSQQLGISVEDLTRLQYAAKLSGIESDKLRDALKDLSKNLVEAANGGGSAVNALNAMGIAVRNSDGTLKTQTQVLREVADKFAGYEDGAAKSTLAMQLMGESGLVMIPLLNQGADGIARMTDESDRLGNTITTNTAKAAEQFNDNLARLQTATAGVARELAGPLIAALADVTTRLLDAMRAGEGFMGTLDAVLNGLGKRSTVAGAQADMDELAQEYIRLEKLARQYSAANQAIPDDIQFAMGKVRAEYKEARANLAELTKAATESSKTAVTPAPLPTPADSAGVGRSVDDQRRENKLVLDLLQAQANQRISILRASNALAAAEDKAALEQGLLSLEEYHARRKASVQAAAEEELAVLRQRVDEAAAMPQTTDQERLLRDAAMVKANTALKVKEIEVQREQISLEREHIKAIEAKEQAVAAAHLKIISVLGNKREVAIAAMEAELSNMEATLQQAGVWQSQIDEILSAYREKMMIKIEFETQKDKGQAIFQELDRFKRDVERDQKVGNLFPTQAAMKMLELDKSRLEVLNQTAAKMIEIAERSGNDAMLAEAMEFDSKVKDLAASTDLYGQAVGRLKETLETSITGGFDDFLDNIIDGSMSAKEAFQSFAFSVMDNIRKIAQELLIQHLTRQFFSMFGGLEVPGIQVRQASAYADGGHVRGPGTGTSDSIPAWLSNGEYVIRAAAVQSVGIDTLNAINRAGRLPQFNRYQASAARFADGGLVGSLSAASGGSSSLTVGLEPGLVLKEMRSKEGQKLVIEALGNNKRAARSVL